jgi:hypothetical protein
VIADYRCAGKNADNDRDNYEKAAFIWSQALEIEYELILTK